MAHSITNNGTDKPPLWLELSRAFGGYWLVSWASAVAGGMLSIDITNSTFISWTELKDIVLMMWKFELLIWPFYFLYGYIFSSSRPTSIKDGRIAYISVFILFLIIVAANFNQNSNNNNAIQWQPIVYLILGITPFQLYAIWLWRTISCKESRDFPFQYRYRFFFTSLMTCGLSFTYGWAVKAEFGWYNLIVPLLSTLIVGSLFWTSLHDKKRNVNLFKMGVLIFFTLFILALVFNTPGMLQDYNVMGKLTGALFFALILTMFICIFESSHIAVNVKLNKHLVRPSENSKNTTSDYRLYQGGVNASIAYLFPMFLVTILHQSVNIAYVTGIYLIILSFLWIWICIDNEGNSKVTYQVLGRIYGFLVLALLVFSAAIGYDFTLEGLPDFLEKVPFSRIIAPFALLVVSIRLAIPFEREYSTLGLLLLGKPSRIEYFSKLHCLSLTMVTSSVLATVIFIIWIMANILGNKVPETDLDPFTNRIALLLILLVFYQVVVWLGERRLSTQYGQKHS